MKSENIIEKCLLTKSSLNLVRLDEISTQTEKYTTLWMHVKKKTNSVMLNLKDLLFN